MQAFSIIPFASLIFCPDQGMEGKQPQQHVRIILVVSLYLHRPVLKCKEDQITWYVFQWTEVIFPWSSLAICAWKFCLFYSIIYIIISSIQYHTILLAWFPEHAVWLETELYWHTWLTDPWLGPWFREVSSFLWIQLASCFAPSPIALVILCLTMLSAVLKSAGRGTAVCAGQSEWRVHNTVKELTLALVFYFVAASELTLCIFCYSFSSWRLSAWWYLEECVQEGDGGTFVCRYWEVGVVLGLPVINKSLALVQENKVGAR